MATPAIVTVDFAHQSKVVDVDGLLVAPSPTYSTAVAKLWDETKPKFTRNTDLTSLALSTGADVREYEIVASEQWGYASNDFYGREPPWANYAPYDQSMTALAVSVGSTPVSWDVWNEPDLSNSWYGTQGQFFTTYLHAYQDMRAVNPANPVGGPSISTFDITYIQAMFDFCVANGCQINFVSWHELASTPTDISQVVVHTKAVRALIASNPAYAVLNIQQLQANESVGALDQYNPAENLAYLSYMEAAKLNAAARSCWPANDGTQNCENETFNGLLTEGTQKPRAVWWVYRMRAGMKHRVELASSSPQVVGIAANRPDDSHGSRVLIGNYLYPGATPNAGITLKLDNMSQSDEAGDPNVTIYVQSIPASGETAQTTMPIIYQVTMPVVNDRVVVTLPRLAMHGVFCVTVASPSAAMARVVPGLVAQ